MRNYDSNARFEEHNKQDMINFGKLHGSLNHYKQEDRRIVKYTTSLNEGRRINSHMSQIGEKYSTITVISCSGSLNFLEILYQSVSVNSSRTKSFSGLDLKPLFSFN